MLLRIRKKQSLQTSYYGDSHMNYLVNLYSLLSSTIGQLLKTFVIVRYMTFHLFTQIILSCPQSSTFRINPHNFLISFYTSKIKLLLRPPKLTKLNSSQLGMVMKINHAGVMQISLLLDLKLRLLALKRKSDVVKLLSPINLKLVSQVQTNSRNHAKKPTMTKKWQTKTRLMNHH